MANLYLIAGMGLSENCFLLLRPLLKWQGEIIFLPHILPNSPTETLTEYTQRLRATLPDTWAEKPSFIGMSLGGMITVELSKLIDYKQLFLISTLKKASEIPLYFKVLRKIPAQKLFSATFSQKYGRKLANWFSNFDKKHLDTVFDMIEQSDKRHLQWGRNAAINWQPPTQKPEFSFAIHGDKDHIFPARNITADYWVKNGTHNLILERAEEIAAVINQHFQ